MRRTLMLLLLSVLAGCASSPNVPGDSGGHFVTRELTIEGRQFRYQVFVPAAHVPRPLPVLLFLHGSGERGDDGIKPTEAGVGPWIKQHMDSFPALVVFPQVPENEEWRGRNARMALAALDAANAEFSTDPTRNYITGISMGGYGTWELALTRPTQFAAVMPICGALLAPRAERSGLMVDQVAGIADPYEAVVSRLHGVPVWMFHGALDALVPARDDRAIAQASQKSQAGFRYTEYPDTEHNAWDPTYRNPAVWEWMFNQRRQ
ncbi:Prolyl oligopeptidase family protein [compost metagenome]